MSLESSQEDKILSNKNKYVKADISIHEMIDRAELLATPEAVDVAYQELADWIRTHCWDKLPIMIAVINGGVRIASEIMKRLVFPMELESIRVGRYGDRIEGKKLNWYGVAQTSLKDRNIILVDDILDKGRTLLEVKKYLLDNQVKSVLTVVLVTKQTDVNVDSIADKTGLIMPNRFLLGEGMDLAGYGRNLRGIWALQPNDERRYSIK